MYATYQYKAGATAADIMNDVVLILTGATNPALLSASCVVAGTEILTTVDTAGWTLHDAAAGTNHKVLVAPWHTDNGVGNNYIGIDANTAGYLHLRVFESWNATTHAATNECYNDTTANYSQRLNVAAGGYIYISAHSGHSCIIHTFQSSVWGNSSSAPTAMVERTRRSPWDTNANAYPVAVWGTASNTNQLIFQQGACPRYVGTTGGDVTASFAIAQLNTPLVALNNNNQTHTYTTLLPGADKIPRHLFTPLYVAYAAAGFFGGNCSKYADVWQVTGAGSALDEVSNNGNTYAVWSCGSSTRITVRKG